jgi:uncharacterized RDD family membrane protein YckC
VTEPAAEHRGHRGPLARITNAAAGAIDVNALVESVDVEALVERIDVDELVSRLDINAVLSRVDTDELLDRVDVNRLLDSVDLDRLLDRVDPDRLLDRVDVNRLMDRVDVDRLVDRAGVADIVGESTGQMAGSVLDAARRQVVAVDEIVGRIAFRMVRKDPNKVPEGPTDLMAQESADKKGRGLVSGHYAGPVSRFLAFLIDVGVVFGIYTLVGAATAFFITGILQVDVPQVQYAPALGVFVLALWAFLYATIGVMLAGRTVGKGLLGLRVVSQDGSPPTARQAAVRALTEPLSFLFFGIGLLGIAFGSKRLAWHDRFARTAVVYDWGDRPAALPAPLTQWLATWGPEQPASGAAVTSGPTDR